ncbi:MAG TPA: M20/M25/M40 family metallo-hydrolase [Planctomycetota bacterium]|nr:M20/M25/M40 family metallo-hydrolase [Planctomycetota bacterium]
MLLLVAFLLQAADLPKSVLESMTSDGIFAHITELASDAYQGREAGTPGEVKAAEYLEGKLKEWKIAPAGVRSMYFQPFSGEGKAMKNVLGWIPGAHAQLKNEFVLIGAHYDHIGMMRDGDDRINNGADDNASGTAVALEIARALGSMKVKPARSVLFGWWSGEERGLLGSKHYVDNPTVNLRAIVACLNLDMVGRNAEDSIDIEGTGCSPDLRTLFDRVNSRKIFKSINYGVKEVKGDTDHFHFFKAGIPAVEFFSGYHADYHKPGDESEKITKPKLEKVARFVAIAAWELANSKSRPAFKKK